MAEHEIEQQDSAPAEEAQNDQEDNEESEDSNEEEDDSEDSGQDSDINERLKELEAENAKLNRQLKRKSRQTEKPSKQKNQDSAELDYGMKAYLKSEGIESSEFDWVQEQMEDSGLPLEKLLSNKYFQSELQSRRNKKSIEKATPGNTRGSTKGSQQSVEYWLNKGELPPNTPENVQLRREVVNARVAREKGSQSFSHSPINYSQ